MAPWREWGAMALVVLLGLGVAVPFFLSGAAARGLPASGQSPIPRGVPAPAPTTTGLGPESDAGGVPVVVVLREQPLPGIASRAALDEGPAATPLGTGGLPGGEEAENLHRFRRDVAQEAGRRMVPSQERVSAFLAEREGVVLYRGRLLNALVARVPTGSLGALASHPDVLTVHRDFPLQGGLAVSAPSVGAPAWWVRGDTGSPWQVAVVDTGIAFSHPYLQAGPAEVFHDAGRFDPYYNDRPDKTEDLHGHGTHIAGIVASGGDPHRGVAFGGGLVNAKFGWRTITGGAHGYWSDGMAAIDWAVLEAGANVISFSFGAPIEGDGTSAFSLYLDLVADSLGVAVVVGVTNAGPDPGTVGIPADAYNVISVGNMYDNDTVPREDDVLHPASGRGPTADGRVKPDVVAPGTVIASTTHAWTEDRLLVNSTGTSMATPHVAAAVALLLSYLEEPAFPALTKALLLNAADDLGPPGADPDFGRGYLNLTRVLAQREFTHLEELGPDRSHALFRAQEGEDGRATLVWHRHVAPADGGFVAQVPNLDLEVYREDDGARVEASTSGRDNVEQVSLDFDEPTILKVTAPSPLNRTERFALAGSRLLEPVRAPAFGLALRGSCGVRIGEPAEVEAWVRNDGGIPVDDVRIRLGASQNLTLVEGSEEVRVARLAPGESARIRWTLEGHTAGTWPLEVAVNGTAVGEEFADALEESLLIQDASRPVITAVRLGPDPVGIGHEAGVDARICAGSGVTQAHLELSRDGDVRANLSLDFDGYSRYSRQWILWELGEHAYRLVAMDGSGTWATVDGTFTVVDLTPPEVYGVAHPRTQEAGAPLRIEARLVDNSSLAAAFASVRDPDGEEVANLTLQPRQAPLWEALLTLREPGLYEARIHAVDAAGNGASRSIAFSVAAGGPPLAAIAAPEEAYAGERVVLSGAGSRDDFGIARYRWTLAGPEGEAHFEGEVVRTVLEEPGTYRVVLVVEDHAGHVAATERQLRVTPRPLAVPVLPAAVLALAAAALAAAWFLRRRP